MDFAIRNVNSAWRELVKSPTSMCGFSSFTDQKKILSQTCAFVGEWFYRILLLLHAH